MIDTLKEILNQRELISVLTQIIAITIVYLVLKIIVSRIYSKKKRQNNKRLLTLRKIFMSLLNYVYALVIILDVLSIFVDTTALLASASVIGIAFALGAKGLVIDVIAGLFIIIENQFEINDTVEISSYKGKVINFGLRTTTLRDWSGEISYVQNGKISNLTNFSKGNEIHKLTFNNNFKDEDINYVIELLEGKITGLNARPDYVIQNDSLVITYECLKIHQKNIEKLLKESISK